MRLSWISAGWIGYLQDALYICEMKRVLIIIWVALAIAGQCMAAGKLHEDAVRGLLERIDPGLSGKIKIEIVDSAGTGYDWFAISQSGWCPMVRGNSAVSVATGINHYLKYVAGVHLSWNDMYAVMPDTLPAVVEEICRFTDMPMRYYLNYCTHSYSMAFWDWERWQREIDWMALHGINMPLAITGTDVLWRNVLRRLGYPEERISSFIAGPGFQAWWLMNNLEGWGGPNTDEYYDRQEHLQKQIVGRMREFGMQPVLPGYSGMLPHDADKALGLTVADPGKWLGYTRPAFMQPTDESFDSIAAVYYDELTKLYGRSRYYSMDPFHEGGNTDGVDLAASGRKIVETMRHGNPDAVWVVQGWQENPRREMIEGLPEGSMVVLDLQAENQPMWNQRTDDLGGHDWLYCMLLNFGGNVGLYGKMDAMIDGFHEARISNRRLKGVGLTMEGIENNPVMYELLCELPWHIFKVDRRKWVSDYARARYGRYDARIDSAWQLLAGSAYNCPANVIQQGTTESVFCARPSDNPFLVSSWADSKEYYSPRDVADAARQMLQAADDFADNSNFIYDLIDVTRQAVADKGRQVANQLSKASESGDKEAYGKAASKFMRLIALQDSLLATHSCFRLGRWLEDARACGATLKEKDRFEWNARVQITTWGNRTASDGGGLHDYAHREWQGLLSDFYAMRWRRWFDERLASWDSGKMPEIDFYDMEEQWANRHNPYSSEPEGDPVSVAKKVFDAAMAL